MNWGSTQSNYFLNGRICIPAPGEFDFEEQQEIFDICEKLGLKVFIQTRLESSPYWLEKKYPEARYVSANGHAVELGPNGNTQCGGYPGLCFHNDAIKQEAENFLRALATAFKDRKCLIGYDCWNEPHLEPAWIDNTWIDMGDRVFLLLRSYEKPIQAMAKTEI